MGKVITDMRTRQGDEQRHDYLVADFSDPAELEKSVKSLAVKRPYHILVNNTGGPPPGPIVDAKSEEFEKAFRQHLVCNHLLVGTLKKGMIDEGYGRIINVISTSVKAPLDNLGVSNTIRGAVASWAKTMANELGQYGITVNNVLPGFTDTERLRQLFEGIATRQGISYDELLDQFAKTIPLGRIARPEEVGAVVAYLASPSASYINGINLPVDGGRTRSL